MEGRGMTHDRHAGGFGAIEQVFYRLIMGSRRTVHEKRQPPEPTRHVWVWPSPSAIKPAQGVVIETMRRDGEPWVRVAYVDRSNPPTLVDTWLPERVCTPVNSQPQEPNY
jgi:hypothetical protein